MRFLLVLPMMMILAVTFSCSSKRSGSDDEQVEIGGGIKSAFYTKIETSDDLPTCDEANDKDVVYIEEDKSLLACSGGEWVDVDIGGSEFQGYILSDDNGQNIGITNQKIASNDEEVSVYVNTESLNLDINLSTGRIILFSCYYTSNDCTGTCYVRFPQGGPAENLVFDSNKVVYQSEEGSEVSVFTPQSYFDEVSDSCVAEADFETNYYPATPLEWQELEYPFAPPFTVE